MSMYELSAVTTQAMPSNSAPVLAALAQGHSAKARSLVPEFSTPNGIPMLANNCLTLSEQSILCEMNKAANCAPLQVKILGIPPSGAKSRVETQIKLCLQLLTPTGEKVTTWKYLRIPDELLPSDKAADNLENYPPDLEFNCLFLKAHVSCSSDWSRKVTSCFGCIQRERNRLRRRKGRNSSPNGSPHYQEVPQKTDDIETEQQKILVLSGKQLMNFNSGDVILPTRITCYCRHHNEKVGFCIHFTVLDCHKRIIATGSSPPIMITDDHKSSSKTKRRKRSTDEEELSPFGRHLSPSPHVAHLHVPPYASDELDGSLCTELSDEPAFRVPYMHQEDGLFIQKCQENGTGGFDFAPALAQNSEDMFPTPPQMPKIFRVIPREGPVSGGVEVTILGTHFYDGLVCWFGGQAARTINIWGPGTLVCILPPSPVAGVVAVTLENHPDDENSETATFTYRDDSEKALLELALQIVGMKINGKLEDARQIAFRILGDTNGVSYDVPAAQPETHDNDSDASAVNPDTKRNVEDVLITTLSPGLFADNPRQTRLLSTQNHNYHTLLHLAALKGFTKLVAHLIWMGVSLDLVDRHGSTALHLASLAGHLECAKLLVDAGASYTKATHSGRSAKDLASGPEMIAYFAELDRMSADQAAASKNPPTSALAETMLISKVAKSRRRKRDRMLYNFWIPIALVMIALGIFMLVSPDLKIPQQFTWLPIAI